MEERFEHKHLMSSAPTPAQLAVHGFDRAFPSRTVRSLYFDSLENDLLHASEEGMSERLKVRLRWYGLAHDFDGASLELKGRKGNSVLKVRRNVTQLEAQRLRDGLVGLDSLLGLLGRDDVPAVWDELLANVGPLQSKVSIAYERTYFFAPKDGLRLTVDTELLCGLAREKPRTPLRPAGHAVVEVKGAPADAARAAFVSQGLNARRTRFSKYAEAMRRVLCGLAFIFAVLVGNPVVRAGDSVPSDVRGGDARAQMIALRETREALVRVAALEEDEGAQNFVTALRSALVRFPQVDRFGKGLWTKPFLTKLGSTLGEGKRTALVPAFVEELFSCEKDCAVALLFSAQEALPAGAVEAFEKALMQRRHLPRSFPAQLAEAVSAATVRGNSKKCAAWRRALARPAGNSANSDFAVRASSSETALKSCAGVLDAHKETAFGLSILANLVDVKAQEEDVAEDGAMRLEEAFVRLGRNISAHDAMVLDALRRALPADALLAPRAIAEDLAAASVARGILVTRDVCASVAALPPELLAFAALSQGTFPSALLQEGGTPPGDRLAQEGGPRRTERAMSPERVRRLRDESALLASMSTAHMSLKESVHNGLGPQSLALLYSLPQPQETEARKLFERVKKDLQALFGDRGMSGATGSPGSSVPANLNPAQLVQQTDAATAALEAALGQARSRRGPACAAVRALGDSTSAPVAPVSATGLPRAVRAYWRAENAAFEAFLAAQALLAQWPTGARPAVALRERVLQTSAPFVEGQTALAGALRAARARVASAVALTRARRGSPATRRSAFAETAALTALSFFHEQVLRGLNVQVSVAFLERTIAEGNRIAASTETERVMNPGHAVGRVVFVSRANLNSHAYARDEILITDGLPLNLGLTAAIITEVYQPRLSHVDLRTRERGTPNAYVKDARARWHSLIGKRAEVRIQEGNVTLTALEAVDGEPKVADRTQSIESKIVPSLARTAPPLDTLPLAPVALDAPPGNTTIARVGAKAFGYANLRRAFEPNTHVPPAFALPFSYYFAFTRATGLDELIRMFLHERPRLSSSEVALRLTLIQKTFEKAARLGLVERQPWYPDLVRALDGLTHATLRENHLAVGFDPTSACFRFRSSSNAEDLLGFTGAGLYDSFTGCVRPPLQGRLHDSTVARAMARTWAGLWNLRAFQEREARGIPHAAVAMALLIHRHWPDEETNGVLITPSRADPTALVSLSPGNVLVTNPDGSRVGEEMRVAFVAGCPDGVRESELSSCPTVILEHTRVGTGPMTTERESAQLLLAGRRITEYFRHSFPTAPQDTLRFDVEFKWMRFHGEKWRRLVVKQARPFLSADVSAPLEPPKPLADAARASQK